MKEEQVPQDEENLNEGKLAKLYYATDSEGRYKKVNSIGWEPETVAMQQAWEVVHGEAEAARQAVISGRASPVLYFMKKNIMTPSLVAGYVGSFGLIVRLHCRPYFFKRLGKRWLERYAYTFRITVEEFIDIERLKQDDR